MGKSAENDEDISFENAMERLEVLVGSLEEGDIPLAELVEKYEEGSKLFQNCNRKLTNAELKIEQLRVENEAASSNLSKQAPES
ncbi:exodeoxyribonuclease VII small subunit [Cerasicoccus fimbriatus]|uniref:exodeoxyribonuclease VII small subunit n=1 Tax=Cerasicoccus fimbriatus TaxID=3014554 RepID=UPI0022B59A71|nr:exodeoxyribonuclease VII small subunit [Cerasicoccus sp. TK19100]